MAVLGFDAIGRLLIENHWLFGVEKIEASENLKYARSYGDRKQGSILNTKDVSLIQGKLVNIQGSLVNIQEA
jgi:hypothetical protein